MRFCYHPDGQIYNESGLITTYAQFMTAHPDFPLIEGHFFDFRDGVYNSINSEGHNFPQEVPQGLLTAINNLGE